MVKIKEQVIRMEEKDQEKEMEKMINHHMDRMMVNKVKIKMANQEKIVKDLIVEKTMV